MNEAVFELKEVSFAYQGLFPALRDISLRFEAGNNFALLGANGSGKSTLLHVLDGLIFPRQGTVCFKGSCLTQEALGGEEFSRLFRRSVGLVFQNPDIQLFCPTVKEDILFGPLQLGLEKGLMHERLARLADTLKIKHLLERSPHQLSLGEKKKAAIASVLILEPEVLLLDEPSSGLDPRTCLELMEIIFDYRRHNRTVITATQDLHLASEIADAVVILSHEDKAIVACGPSGEILAKQELLNKYNLVHLHSHRHGQAWHRHPHQHACGFPEKR